MAKQYIIKTPKRKKKKVTIFVPNSIVQINTLELTRLLHQEYDTAYKLGYSDGVKDAISKLPTSKPNLEYKIPEGCAFICHICQPPVALASIDDRPQHMREVHHALKW